jgi:hypothetical protein
MHNVHIMFALSDLSRGLYLSHFSYYSQDGRLSICDQYVCGLERVSSTARSWRRCLLRFYVFVAIRPTTLVKGPLLLVQYSTN